MNLKKQLSGILRARGMSASDLSKQTGISKQTLSDWLSGSEPRKLSQVKKVAEALGITVDQLCFGDESTAKSEPKVTDIDSLLGNGWISGVFEVRFRRIKK